MIEDGYCGVCGLSAAPKPPAPPPASPARSMPTATGTGSTPISRAAFGTRSSRRSSSQNARKQLGADLVTLPDLPSTAPENALMAEARVPENKRYCGRCDHKLSRERGFCGKCGQRYSFIATLKPGDVIAAHYEVKGALAYGGLGWIYLAFDRLLSRYVVLKGLLNTEDAAAAAVAVAERQFLAAVRHPNIVGIYNFVQLDSEGFIVMEYVGGQTLRDVRRKRGPLPPAEAIAYIHRILGAFSYLHRMGLVYCDFKPENVMLECDDVKLIDLGGVRRLGDQKGDIYGTVGYSAPEASDGPTIESDLFTIGRTLAVLLIDIRGFGAEHLHTLPGPDQEPLFAEQESLYRFLLKATAPNASDRFESAEIMADQLLGVLREVVAAQTGIPRPGSGNLFSGDLLSAALPHYLDSIGPDYRQLPMPLIDPADPASNLVRDAAALPTSALRVEALGQLFLQWPDSVEAPLRLANCLIDSGHEDEAGRLLTTLEQADPWDWRANWIRGRLLLSLRKPLEAQAIFDQIYFDLPGELAPKLAFAMAAEQAGNFNIATRMYDLVARTDPNFGSACFGLARCLAEAGDRRGSVAALNRIPPESNLHSCSRVEATRSMIRNGRSMPGLEELATASSTLEELSVDGIERHRLAGQVFAAALKLLVTGHVKASSSVRVLGYPVKESYMRQGLEQSLRAVARLAPVSEKIRLIDEANRVRPRTLF